MTATMTESSTSTVGKKRSSGFDVIRWIEKHCVFTQGRWRGYPFVLLPWQQQMLIELFEVDGDNRRLYRWAYISVAKKNGKTELMAALALWFMIGSGEPSPWVVCAAGSDDQADLLFDAAKTMAEESPTLSQVCETGENLVTVPSIPGAKLQRVAASARRHGSNLDGKNLFVVICDELHVWEGERARIVWGTLTRALVAREEPMVIQITTAGYDRESICWEQYQHAKRVEADPDIDPSFYSHIVEAPAGADHEDSEVWEAANPSWGEIMVEGFYADQVTKQPENEFRRFYLNQWTRSAESWLPAGAWEACEDGQLDIPDGAEVTVGVDVALYHDTTSVVWVWKHPDGRHVIRSKVWEPVTDEGIDLGGVMQHIRDLADPAQYGFTLREVTYDPRFFDYPAQMLADEGFPMVEFPQSADRMVPVCGFAYQTIAAGKLVHDGDPILTEHVLSASQRSGERGWTLSKGKSKHVIDACIAMVIALYRSEEPTTPEATWFGGWG